MFVFFIGIIVYICTLLYLSSAYATLLLCCFCSFGKKTPTDHVFWEGEVTTFSQRPWKVHVYVICNIDSMISMLVHYLYLVPETHYRNT